MTKAQSVTNDESPICYKWRKPKSVTSIEDPQTGATEPQLPVSSVV